MTTELAVPKGHGRVKVGHNLRVDVPMQDWQSTIGTDYWLMAGDSDLSTVAGATNPSGLSGHGWITTGLAYTNAGGADFMSSSDDVVPSFDANSDSDVLKSPFIFGNYSHQLAVGQKLGYLPTRLVADFYAAFGTASSDENGAAIGFWHGSSVSAAIYSDATNFQLYNGSAEDAGATIDTAYHQWRISLNSADSLMTWWIDGTRQGTVAVRDDVWPSGFGFESSTNNRPNLAWAHVWYE